MSVRPIFLPYPGARLKFFFLPYLEASDGGKLGAGGAQAPSRLAGTHKPLESLLKFLLMYFDILGQLVNIST
jgi:hypothetical protein